jgi:hypothetical protein
MSGSILMPGNVSGCFAGSFGSLLGSGVVVTSLSMMRSFFPPERRLNSSIPERAAFLLTSRIQERARAMPTNEACTARAREGPTEVRLREPSRCRIPKRDVHYTTEKQERAHGSNAFNTRRPHVVRYPDLKRTTRIAPPQMRGRRTECPRRRPLQSRIPLRLAR